MVTAKLVLIYPRPQDEAAFEQVYRDEHIPILEQKLKGLNRFVTTRVVGYAAGSSAHLQNRRSPLPGHADTKSLHRVRKRQRSDGAC